MQLWWHQNWKMFLLTLAMVDSLETQIAVLTQLSLIDTIPDLYGCLNTLAVARWGHIISRRISMNTATGACRNADQGARARACVRRLRIPIFGVPCARARKAPCGPTAPAINEPWTNINDPVPSFPVKINISHCITMLQFLGWHNNNIWRQQENI